MVDELIILAKSGNRPYPINPNQRVIETRRKIRLKGGISGITSVKIKAMRAKTIARTNLSTVLISNLVPKKVRLGIDKFL
jgi:hypothetical protein